jgi:DNA (cytosine-5)-methyltransferase 1
MLRPHPKPENRIRAIDLFCGAGGSSWGARAAGAQIVAAFDMWKLAGQVYQDNFPDTKFYRRKLEGLRPKEIASQLGKIDLMLASPECTNHSPARGNRARSEASRLTAFQVTRFARIFKPRWIVVENVVSMRKWARYKRFIQRLRKLGYFVREQVLNAADFGVPQARRRLFLLCSRDNKPAKVLPPSGISRKSARVIVNMNGVYRYSPLHTPSRATATMERAQRGMKALGPGAEFLLVYYGSDAAGGWQSLDVPLRTITTLDRFALVKPDPHGYVMRMLQPPELQAAMGFPPEYKLEKGTRRDRIHLLGNAVCPPVMASIVRALIRHNRIGWSG